MFKRALRLPPPGEETFFLWGPRQTGKTTLLREAYSDGVWVDLLKADEFRRYATRPELLRQELEAAETRPGRWLPAYRKRPKRRVIQAPKFYFADVGVVNRLARRGMLQRGSELYGRAFENWAFHELTASLSYGSVDADLTYWRLAGGTEVDFVLGDMEVAVEAKSSSRVTSDHLKGLRSLVADHPSVRRRIVVCLEPKPRTTPDGIEILPATSFVDVLRTGPLS